MRALRQRLSSRDRKRPRLRAAMPADRIPEQGASTPCWFGHFSSADLHGPLRSVAALQIGSRRCQLCPARIVRLALLGFILRTWKCQRPCAAPFATHKANRSQEQPFDYGAKEPMLEQTTHSDVQGNYTFIGLRGGSLCSSRRNGGIQRHGNLLTVSSGRKKRKTSISFCWRKNSGSRNRPRRKRQSFLMSRSSRWRASPTPQVSEATVPTRLCEPGKHWPRKLFP